MKYATWKLNFSNPDYGTGPEGAINAQGCSAEAAYVNGDVTQGAEILGYFTGEPTDLEIWNFTEITQEEALSFVLSFDETASIDTSGKIKILVEFDTTAAGSDTISFS